MTGPDRQTAVLVVEDNERNLKLVRDVLDFAGFLVHEARTGEEGLAVARQVPVDIVLMDLQLPGIDGTEARRALRADPRTADLPVIAVTASAMKEDRERVLAAGFDGYLEKPISAVRLADQIREFLSLAAKSAASHGPEESR
jgi:two-component system cell cycle response regulator DivK